jgi:hypothetical protein
MNQRVDQWFGTKSSSLWPAKVQLLTKKKAKMTMMEVRMHHQSFLYIDALTVCFLWTRSLRVKLRLLSVQT